MRLVFGVAALPLLAGCFVTTDENLWKQRKEAGPDINVADVSWQEAAAEQGPGPDGPRPEGPDVDGPAPDGPAPDMSLVDAPPQPDMNKDPNGTPCSLGQQLQHRPLRGQRLLQRGLRRRVRGLRPRGPGRDLQPVCGGHRSGRRLRPGGREHLRQGRHVRRQRRLPHVRRGHGVQPPRSAPAATAYSVKTCSAAGSCATTPEVACTPYRCESAAGTCYTSCSSDAQCYLYKCDLAASTCYSSCTSGAECQSNKCIGGGKCK